MCVGAKNWDSFGLQYSCQAHHHFLGQTLRNVPPIWESSIWDLSFFRLGPLSNHVEALPKSASGCCARKHLVWCWFATCLWRCSSLCRRKWLEETTAKSHVQPLINLGHGFMYVPVSHVPDQLWLTRYYWSGFNPPDFLIASHKQALDDIDANQYGPALASSIPTEPSHIRSLWRQGRQDFKSALVEEFSPIFHRTLSPDEIAVTAGATAAILSCLMAFVKPGDEVIVIEPMFNL